MKRYYHKYTKINNKPKRVFLSLIALITSIATITTSINIVTAKVIPESQMEIFEKGIRRLDIDGAETSTPDDPCTSIGSITWIGDSLSVGAEVNIKSSFSGVDLYAQVSKHFGNAADSATAQDPAISNDSSGGPSGISILKYLNDNNALHDTIVFALGTNDSISQHSIDAVVGIITDQGKNVVFITNYVNGAKENNNSKMFTAANADNVAVADWASVASSYVASDGVHFASNDGKKIFVETVSTALSKFRKSTGGGNLGGPAPTSLTGGDNAEKIWNYFKARGLTDVAAAGALGNLRAESGSTFDPYIGESGDTSWAPEKMNSGFGIIQWTNTTYNGVTSWRRRDIINHLISNGITAPDRSKEDQALLLELNWLWDGEYGKMTWQEEVNAETTVDGDPKIDFRENNTGNGSTLLFHALVERSGDKVEGKQRRIDYAKEFLERFNGTSGC